MASLHGPVISGTFIYVIRRSRGLHVYENFHSMLPVYLLETRGCYISFSDKRNNLYSASRFIFFFLLGLCFSFRVSLLDYVRVVKIMDTGYKIIRMVVLHSGIG
jgi:hypothetical protein